MSSTLAPCPIATSGGGSQPKDSTKIMEDSIRSSQASSKLNQEHSRIVVLLHGIRTDAYWHQQFQEVVSALSGEKETLILSRKYGNFSALQYAIPVLRRNKVRWLRQTLEDLQLRHPRASICIIAHSFGTFLATEVLKRAPRLRVDSLILCGSVVKREFEWNKLTDNNNVKQVLNDCGAADLWPVLSRVFIPGTGDSGTFGFDNTGGRVRNRFFQYYDHGAFFTQTHIAEYWWPFISFGTIEPGPTPVPRPVFMARFIAAPLGRFATRMVIVGSMLLPLYILIPHDGNLLEPIQSIWSISPHPIEPTKKALSGERPASVGETAVENNEASRTALEEINDRNAASRISATVARKLEQAKFEDVWQSHVSHWLEGKATKQAFIGNMALLQSRIGGTERHRELVQMQSSYENRETGYKGQVFGFLYSLSSPFGKIYQKIVLVNEENDYKVTGISYVTESGDSLLDFGMP